MPYLTDTSHPETRVMGGPSRVQIAEVVAVNTDDGTIDASLLNGRATKVHVAYPTWWVPQVGERCLLADRDGDVRQPICLGFLSPADGSNAGPQLQGTVSAGSLPKASDTAFGITKLATAPAVAADPIAVGDNDPRNTDARTPTGAAGGDLSGTYPSPSVVKATDAVYGKTRLSVAAASAADPIAVGDNDTRVPTAGEAAALLGTSGTPGSGNKYVTDADARNTNSRAPTGAAGGDLASTYPNPTVAKLSATATRFGTGGELRSAAADTVVLSENYDSVADRLIDTTKPGWRIILGNSADQLLIQRAPATAGSPVFATLTTLASSGYTKFVDNIRFGTFGAYVSMTADAGGFGFNGNWDPITGGQIDGSKPTWRMLTFYNGGAFDSWGIQRAPATGNTSTAPTYADLLKMTPTAFGVFGVTPAARPTAYTQTYATASRTHSNPTAVAVATTAATSTTPFGYTTAAQANAIVTAINALITDVANVKQVLNSVIDDHQAYGWLQ